MNIDYERNAAIWDNFASRYNGNTQTYLPPARLEAMPGLEETTDYYMMPMGDPNSAWYDMAWWLLSDFLWNGDVYEAEKSALRAMDAQ